MLWTNALSKVIIIAANMSLSYSLWGEFSTAQTLIGSEVILSPTTIYTTDDYHQERLIEGMEHGMKGDYQRAIAIFSELIQRNPNDADAYFNRGIAREELHDYQGAIADQTQALTLNPQLADAYRARAKLYWQLGDQQTAIKDLGTAIKLFEVQENLSSQNQAQGLMDQWKNP